MSKVMKVITVFLLAAALNARASELSLPEALTTQSGQKVDSPELWKGKRRAEILELFRENVYGRVPESSPGQLRFEVTNLPAGSLTGKAKAKEVRIAFRGPGGEGAISLRLCVPVGTKGPVPCFLLICNRGASNIDITRQTKSSFWPVESLVARGYAAAAFSYTDVAPDTADSWSRGVFRIFGPVGQRSADAWGAIAAWAWGASRVMDYLQTDPDIDPKRIAIVGHSRGGKAALWAGAQDERFAMVVSNESGSTGAALARDKKGERISDINRVFPHWFCENYKRYNGRERELPVDQHMLLALIAPRLLYVASATEDSWSDPNNEFLAAVYAEPVYRLFGLEGLTVSAMPKPESPVQSGCIGYHLRTGKHNLTDYDWARFMDFADRHMRKAGEPVNP